MELGQSYVEDLLDEIEEVIQELEPIKEKKPMKFVYAGVKEEDIQTDVEYPVFMEWDKNHKCTVHIYLTDDATKAHDERFKETNCKVFPLKHRRAKMMFTIKVVV